ncbi:uncharacterized protein L969DRAFT_92007 [Mixia osmundae IAM 14324]|uniref:Early meiotic induction protein 1 n=1 Tax=Mixia osmundae (strain CBS 9802 / IAM 14324 / JCM 22182 / KY 12970) TaxID=764103 RepID=G7E2W3_MIXOS|nr:uncharacterized protein L969DRAFT_92007 [Mixia osmundae IAM 14324]KEI42569.1 hypothetical protein L969DRAFT_92007 [Mixia osmundae IAM 14324]GAA97144.1 hypothetical protein E5Q_03819 [Mixia osmundae IAM 14324]
MNQRDSAFDAALAEEMEVQRASVAMEGGMPSCMKLFDRMFSCHSVRAQVKGYYRLGGTPDCSWHYENFKFCLSVKSLPKPEREEEWIARRARWWTTRRLNGSSEDFWTTRPIQAHLQELRESSAEQ